MSANRVASYAFEIAAANDAVYAPLLAEPKPGFGYKLWVCQFYTRDSQNNNDRTEYALNLGDPSPALIDEEAVGAGELAVFVNNAPIGNEQMHLFAFGGNGASLNGGNVVGGNTVTWPSGLDVFSSVGVVVYAPDSTQIACRFALTYQNVRASMAEWTRERHQSQVTHKALGIVPA